MSSPGSSRNAGRRCALRRWLRQAGQLLELSFEPDDFAEALAVELFDALALVVDFAAVLLLAVVLAAAAFVELFAAVLGAALAVVLAAVAFGAAVAVLAAVEPAADWLSRVERDSAARALPAAVCSPLAFAALPAAMRDLAALAAAALPVWRAAAELVTASPPS